MLKGGVEGVCEREGEGEDGFCLCGGDGVQVRRGGVERKLISRVDSIHFAADVATRGQVKVCHC